MTTYGQTSKEIHDEYEKEEEPIEEEYIRTFPKKFSSSLPRVRLGVDLPNSMNNNMDALRIKIPHSDIYNKGWKNFDSRLLGRRKRY